MVQWCRVRSREVGQKDRHYKGFRLRALATVLMKASDAVSTVGWLKLIRKLPDGGKLKASYLFPSMSSQIYTSVHNRGGKNN